MTLFPDKGTIRKAGRNLIGRLRDQRTVGPSAYSLDCLAPHGQYAVDRRDQLCAGCGFRDEITVAE